MGFIYKITSPSNKPYVGQTKRKVPEKRWKEHCQNSLSGNSHCTALVNAIRKYGAENMKFEVIEECPDDMLNEREHFWIEKLNSLRPNGYNLTTGGGAFEFSEESKAKMSATRQQKSIGERGYIGCVTKNHSGTFKASGTDSAQLGTFSTLEEAETALREYTRDPENFVPIFARRKSGTGCVHLGRSGRWLAQLTQNKETIRIGLYETKKEAEDALEEYLRAPDDFTLPESREVRKRGTGCVRATQGGRWRAWYSRKNLGTFDTQEEAEDAIERYKLDPGTFVAPHHKRKTGTGSVFMKGHRWEAAFCGKYLGLFDSKDKAEAAIQAHIASQTV